MSTSHDFSIKKSLAVLVNPHEKVYYLFMREKIKGLLTLYLTFCKIGIMTFGGGLSMMPIMQRELIDKRHWITEDDLIDYYAIGQATPGIIAVNVSTFIGYKQFGVLGGIVGTLGIISPSLLIILALAHLITSVSEFPWVQKALAGINVAVASLLTKITFDFCKKTVKNLFTLAVFLASFSLIYFLKIPSFLVILGVIALGILVHFINVFQEKRARPSSTTKENAQKANEKPLNASQISEQGDDNA